MERALRQDRVQKRREGTALPRGRSGVRPRQHQILLPALRSGAHRQRHGSLVGRSSQRRDPQRLGLRLPRCREDAQPDDLRADLAGRRARPAGKSARRGAARRAPLCAGARGGTLPGIHAQHEFVVGHSGRFAPLAVVHPEVRHDHLNHGLCAFQLRSPARRPGARRAAHSAPLRRLRRICREVALHPGTRRQNPRRGVCGDLEMDHRGFGRSSGASSIPSRRPRTSATTP